MTEKSDKVEKKKPEPKDDPRLKLAFRVQQAVLFRCGLPTEKEPSDWHVRRAEALLAGSELDKSNDPVDFMQLAAQDAFDAVILSDD